MYLANTGWREYQAGAGKLPIPSHGPVAERRTW